MFLILFGISIGGKSFLFRLLIEVSIIWNQIIQMSITQAEIELIVD